MSICNEELSNHRGKNKLKWGKKPQRIVELKINVEIVKKNKNRTSVCVLCPLLQCALMVAILFQVERVPIESTCRSLIYNVLCGGHLMLKNFNN